MAADLVDLNVDALRARYDPAALCGAQIYPEIWYESDVFNTYLALNFVSLNGLFLAAADQEQAVLLAMT